MIYPTLHLHRIITDEKSIDYYAQPAFIEDFEPIETGGTLIRFKGPDGGCAKVNESPDMIAKGIVEAISQQAAASTKGAIQMNISAQQAMAQQQDKKIIEARGGLPPFNGG